MRIEVDVMIRVRVGVGVRILVRVGVGVRILVRVRVDSMMRAEAGERLLLSSRSEVDCSMLCMLHNKA